jgi:hypothetical protein
MRRANLARLIGKSGGAIKLGTCLASRAETHSSSREWLGGAAR